VGGNHVKLRRREGTGGALPMTMVVRPWVTWSVVEAQKMPKVPLRLEMDDIIFVPGREVGEMEGCGGPPAGCEGSGS